MTSELGDGWTIERVRVHAADPTAQELSLDRVVYAQSGQNRVRLRPRAIVRVGGLILVRDGEDWYMGETDPDGDVLCWSPYGDDLGGAIDAL